MENYLSLLKKEIRTFTPYISEPIVNTIYFGGGTPSLLPANHIVSIIDALAKEGSLHIASDCEITIEINPATLDNEKLDLYRGAGVNRYSVGAQTFHEHHLKQCGRIHTANETRETLDLLDKHNLNYSFDLLFGLPNQTLKELSQDLDQAMKYNVNHLSAYCLTVPSGHPMAANRADDAEQIAMFALIEEQLAEKGIDKYEISNFSRPGYESQHNLLYWTDQSYWGIGLSAHSYFPKTPLSPFGSRFWNPKEFSAYKQFLSNPPASLTNRTPELVEHLKEYESLTDYCHTRLRTRIGLNIGKLKLKFPKNSQLALKRLENLVKRELLARNNSHFWLTTEGEALSNLIFSEMTFIEDEIS